MLEKQGWKPHAFEPATFVRRKAGKVVGLMVLHVDDFLLAVAPGAGKAILQELGADIDLGSLTSCQDSAQTFCGREYRQDADRTVRITMDGYRQELEPYALARHRAKQPEDKLTPTEHRGFRKVLGQLQWASRMMFFEEACTASLLSAWLAEPSVQHLVDANAALRRVRKQVGT